VRPVISPACPAVVNLIETRFPSLIPHLAPFRSALEAMQAALAGCSAAFVVSCPCQRTVLLAGETPTPPGETPTPPGETPTPPGEVRSAAAEKPTIVSPAVLRGVLQPRLRRQMPETSPETSAAVGGIEANDRSVLRVTGVRHVLAVLEAIENRLAEDLRVVEPWICDEGCLGSPLWSDDPFLARQRWDPAIGRKSAGAAPVSAKAIRRSTPFSARPGLRLDNDMTRAIAKLAKIDQLARSLPGGNCAMCGAPTCAALAEDVVLGRASADACVRQNRADSAARNQEKLP
jgi:hypothetical protein